MANNIVQVDIDLQANKQRFIQIFNDKIKREGADKLLNWLQRSDFFEAPASSKFHNAIRGGLCDHSLNVYDRVVALVEFERQFERKRLADKSSLSLEEAAIQARRAELMTSLIPKLNIDPEKVEKIVQKEIAEGKFSGGGNMPTLLDGVTDENIAIATLLHDLCKVDYYKVSQRNKKDEVTGQWVKEDYFSIDEALPYGHGEKSVYIISGFMRLERIEAMAINWHMGGFDKRVIGGDFSLSKAFEQYPFATLVHVADIMATYFDENRA